MSGEKCSSYQVQEDRNAILQAARLAASRESAEEARARLDKLLRRAPDLVGGDPIPQAGPEASADELDAYAAAARALSGKLDRRIANREALSRLDSLSSGGDAGEWRGPDDTSPVPAADPVERRQARKALVGRLVGRLRDVAPKEAEQVCDLAAALIDCTDVGRASRLEAELRDLIVQANRAADSRRSVAARIEALQARLGGLEGRAVEALRARLTAPGAGEAAIPPDLEAEVEWVRRAALDEVDRLYVARVFREELRKHGYEVPEEEFETAFVQGGEIAATDSRNPPYGVRIKSDLDARTFDMKVVRFGDGEAWSPLREQRDRAVEEDFCRRQEQFRGGMRAAGIDNALIRHVAAGEEPVETVASGTAGSARVRTTGKRLKTMSRKDS